MIMSLKNDAWVTEYTKYQYKDTDYFFTYFSEFSEGTWICEENELLDDISLLNESIVKIDSLKNEWVLDTVSDPDYDGWEFSDNTPEDIKKLTENIMEDEGASSLESNDWIYLDTEYVVEGGLNLEH